MVGVMSNFKSAWIAKSSSSNKPWGSEVSWTGGYAGNVKTLSLKKGERTSFKINLNKDEMLICGSGKLTAYFSDEQLIKLGVGELKVSTLETGNALVVQSGCPYRIEALEDSTILEVSSQSQNSVIRLHDDYGRETATANDRVTEIINREWGD